VLATDATKLAVIQQLDPIYVNFTQSSADLLKLRHALEAGKFQSRSSNDAKVTLLLEDGTSYAAMGKLLFSDISVDETTGSVTLRSEFPNSEKLLLPGMFVRGWIEMAVDRQTITVPQRAVTRDANSHASVFLVNAQNQVETREIQTGSVFGDKWIVSGGLQPGERVIVEGLQKIRPGATVATVPFQSGDTNPSPASAAAHP
jgi:membrane fusion protein (multidrug efflux system)